MARSLSRHQGLGLSLTLLALIACKTPGPGGSLRSDDAREAGAAAAHVVDFTILQLNDVYEITPVESGKKGGLARVATLRKQLLAENPNLITLLSGDFLSPSAMGVTKVDGELLAGRQMVDALNSVGIDYVTFGNHEFDVTEAQLLSRIKESKFKWVASNVFDASMHLFPGTIENAVTDVHGSNGETVHVGFFGVCLDMAKKPHVRYREPIEVSKEEATKLAGADVLVAITHMDAASDKLLAAAVPRLDVLLGGHEHEAAELVAGEDHTHIFKADSNARTVYVHRFHYDLDTKKVAMDSTLVDIDAGVPEDPATKAIVDGWVTKVFTALKASGTDPEEVVGNAGEYLNGFESAVRNHPTNLTSLIGGAFLDAEPEAEAAIYGSGSIRIDDQIAPGKITNYDIVRIFPFGGRMILVKIQGDTLVKALDQGNLNKGSGGYLLTANLEKDAAGAWRVKGEPVNPSKVYRVLFNDFLLTGMEKGLGFLAVDQPANNVFKMKDSKEVRVSLSDKLKTQMAP